MVSNRSARRNNKEKKVNNYNYKPIIEQAERAESTEEKVDCIITFLKIFANHIPSRIKRIERLLIIFGVAILMVLLGTNTNAWLFVLSLIKAF